MVSQSESAFAHAAYGRGTAATAAAAATQQRSLSDARADWQRAGQIVAGARPRTCTHPRTAVRQQAEQSTAAAAAVARLHLLWRPL